MNREKVPRIWEGEGSRRSEILNPVNNDYWVDRTTGTLILLAGAAAAAAGHLMKDGEGGRWIIPGHGSVASATEAMLPALTGSADSISMDGD